ncbi:MAG: hypothetical protein MUC43_06980 [Pirellula sp.]|nr:hypothetical protein [Pirellula sp.]
MTSSNATRYSLIQDARSRSSTAWEQLVHIYSPLIQAWGRRLGCQSDELDMFMKRKRQVAARQRMR